MKSDDSTTKQQNNPSEQINGSQAKARPLLICHLFNCKLLFSIIPFKMFLFKGLSNCYLTSTPYVSLEPL